MSTDTSTELHKAAENEESLEILKNLLRDKLYPLNSLDSQNWTPLISACANKNLEACKLLLKAGADPTIATSNGATALHYLARIPIEGDPKKSNVLQTIKLAIDKGANVNAKNRSGATALHEAAFQGSPIILQLLLKSGANVAEEDKRQETALHFALRALKKENAEVLLKNGADPFAANKRGSLMDVIPKNAEDRNNMFKLVNEFKQDKVSDENKLLVVAANSIDELPEKYKREIFGLGFNEELLRNNFENILGVISFLMKKRFFIRAPNDLIKEQEVGRQFTDIAPLGLSKTFFIASVINPNNRNAPQSALLIKNKNKKKRKRIMNAKHIVLSYELSHPNLPTYFSNAFDDDDCWVAFELTEGAFHKSILIGDILKIRFLSEPESSYIIRQILKALHYLHGKTIIHRNIEPNSIMLNIQRKVKLLDLRFAEFEIKASDNIKGNHCYIAPEIIIGNPATVASDIWSVGATVIAMIRKILPFQNYPTSAMLLAAVGEKTHLDDWQTNLTESSQRIFSQPLINFVNKCIQKNPTLRPTAEELYKYEFITLGPTYETFMTSFVEIFQDITTPRIKN
eukprot:TRINITY_DN8616_c0_g1_i1.p1 TRINITY_DN8616_c0_g1~~TRINITY_DN8616_c0_g1_i1.p1  ORF type:complete len:573 (+),score=245.27 TRINITY_DN8616_c0_g1_i1:15-1733(+)